MADMMANGSGGLTPVYNVGNNDDVFGNGSGLLAAGCSGILRVALFYQHSRS